MTDEPKSEQTLGQIAFENWIAKSIGCRLIDWSQCKSEIRDMYEVMADAVAAEAVRRETPRIEAKFLECECAKITNAAEPVSECMVTIGHALSRIGWLPPDQAAELREEINKAKDRIMRDAGLAAEVEGLKSELAAVNERVYQLEDNVAGKRAAIERLRDAEQHAVERTPE